jgi:hypothetical protein
MHFIIYQSYKKMQGQLSKLNNFSIEPISKPLEKIEKEGEVSPSLQPCGLTLPPLRGTAAPATPPALITAFITRDHRCMRIAPNGGADIRRGVSQPHVAGVGRLLLRPSWVVNFEACRNPFLAVI